MKPLHIVQGGIENGDKAWLERAARHNWQAKTWIVPKSARRGDDIVIFVPDHGFFATAKILSTPKPRKDWPNRYGAGLVAIRLIKPAISCGTIKYKIPQLTWAKYPRSITTPIASIAKCIRKLITHRRRTGLPALGVRELEAASLDELRKVALSNARSMISAKKRKAFYRTRSRAIRLYVLSRAKGFCEGCNAPAPFRKSNKSPYLEPHHTTRLSDDGPDHPAKVISLCPNCHRRAHYAENAKQFNASLMSKLVLLEKRPHISSAKHTRN